MHITSLFLFGLCVCFYFDLSKCMGRNCAFYMAKDLIFTSGVLRNQRRVRVQ